MKLKIFFCQFPNPWALRVSGMGGYTSKCEKKSKSLHPNGQSQFLSRNPAFFLYTVLYMAAIMRIYAGEPWSRACAVQHSLLRSLHPTHPSSNHSRQGGLLAISYPST